MRISLTAGRLKKIARGVRENSFFWFPLDGGLRVAFTWDKKVIYVSDLYDDLLEFLTGFYEKRSGAKPLDLIFKLREEGEIINYSYDEISHMADTQFNSINFLKIGTSHEGNFFDRRLLQGLISRKFTYELVRNKKVPAGFLFVYSADEPTDLVAIVFGYLR